MTIFINLKDIIGLVILGIVILFCIIFFSVHLVLYSYKNIKDKRKNK